MSIMNTCAKFQEDITSSEKVKINLTSAIELLETADFVCNFGQKSYTSEQFRWHI